MPADSPCRLRQAEAGDESFILSLTERFVAFPLPPWRERGECARGIRADLLHHLDEPPPSSWLFVAEDADGVRVGFLHLQKTRDYFTGRMNCHISDLVTAQQAEGRGIGQAMLHFATEWAREHRCELVTLNVFPGNERARRLYAAQGFDVDMLRLARPLSPR